MRSDAYCNGVMTVAAPLRPTAAELLALAAAPPGHEAGREAARVRRIEAAGGFYWVKTEERLTLRMRLQKGDTHRAFVTEREAMKSLSAAGLAVPPVLAEGAGCFVMPDCGPTLRQILRKDLLPAPGRPAVFRAAGAALAAFHARGYSHGRPSLRDTCWDGQAVRFIDFERYRPRHNTPAGHSRDLVMLMLSGFTETGCETDETAALAEGYRAHDPGGIWIQAARLCRRLRWLDPLTRPIQRRGAPEFRAIPLTLRAFGV